MEIDEVEELDCSKMENSRSPSLDLLNCFMSTRTEMGVSH